MVQANFHSFETLTFEHLPSLDFLLAAYGTHSFGCPWNELFKKKMHYCIKLCN